MRRTMRFRRRFASVLIVTLLPASLTGPSAVSAADQVLVGAGDIASCTTNADSATANLLDDISGTVFTLGDNAYPDGSKDDYEDCYDPTWGRHRSRTRPAAGNHEYETTGAGPYFSYFGAAAGTKGEGWYSYDLGSWHVVVLNSNCSEVGGCGLGSPQVDWLQDDLAANAGEPVLAYWHHPRFSSGPHGSSSSMRTFWEVLYAAGAEVVLSGHDHDYERFAPQDPTGERDDRNGIRQFVVGTGGGDLRSGSGSEPNSEAFQSVHGVLRLTLRADGYDWKFVPVAGETWTDSGSDKTHHSQSSQTFQATADAHVDQALSRVAFGRRAHLWADAATGDDLDRRIYIRFRVTGLTGPVRRATLGLWVTNRTQDGPRVRPTSTAWSESRLTWHNRPVPTGPAVADAGALAAGTWAEFDVTSLVQGNGPCAFLLRSTSGDAFGASSREGDHPPTLEVVADT